MQIDSKTIDSKTKKRVIWIMRNLDRYAGWNDAQCWARFIWALNQPLDTCRARSILDLAIEFDKNYERILRAKEVENGRGHIMAREICYAHGDACSSDCRFRVFRVV